MKKLLILLVGLAIAIPTFSQDYRLYETSKFSVDDGTGNTFINTKLYIKMYLDDNRLVILSEELQIIDYIINSHHKDDDGYDVFKCTVTNADRNPVTLIIAVKDIADIGIFLIQYRNISYGYVAHFVKLVTSNNR